MESKGHFCYGCNEYFHDSNSLVITHKGCKGKKSLGVCVDSKEFGDYHPYNLEDKTKLELITIIHKLSNQINGNEFGLK
jgi:hypothetical protein